MLRSGSAENLLAHLARQDVLHLRNIQTGGEWGGGVRPPSNMTTYAYYLDTRIKSFRDLRHDLVFSQTESNRRSTGLGANSKARRLRHLPVEKGLLREVKQVQRILDALIRCTFYDDDLRDENTVLAYRLLIKDLLVLFQAGNEGVCNILEHYFEMSKIDATDAFEIYKSFIKQTDKIVDYLAIARRLNNIVNVPVPTLKHAPTSLVKALEEYLNDPNFEQNRLEYKRSLGVVEGKSGSASKNGSSPQPKPKEDANGKKEASSSSDPAPATAATQQKIQDFLDSIESEQEKLNNLQQNAAQQQQAHQQQMMQFGAMGGPGGQQVGMGSIGSMGSMNSMATSQLHPQMTGANPFRQSVMFPQQTGMPLSGFPQQQQQHMQMQPQATGFGMGMGMQQQQMQPQATGFLQPQRTGQLAFGHVQHQQQPHQQQQFMQSQPTGFLQPQTTGSNPFRQSMLSGSNSMGNLAQHAQQSSGGFSPPSSFARSGSFSQPSGSFFPSTSSSNFTQPSQQSGFTNQSTPFQQTSQPFQSTTSPGSPKPLTAQKTGSNNPFAPPGGIQPQAPPVPKMPNLNELAQQKYQQQFAQAGGLNPTPASQQQHHHQQSQPQRQQTSPWDPLGPSTSNGGTGMSDIASAFALDGNQNQNQQNQNQQNQGHGQGQTNDLLSSFDNLSFGGGSTSPSGAGGAGGAEFLQPQKTGFGGSTVKPFQPTSSFGKSLMESLPPIAEPGASPAPLSGQNTGFPFSGQFTSSPAQSPGLLGPSANGSGSTSPFAPSQSFGNFGQNFGQQNGQQGQQQQQNGQNGQTAQSQQQNGQTQQNGQQNQQNGQQQQTQTQSSLFPPRANSISSPTKFNNSPFAPRRSATTDPTFSQPLQPQTTGSNPFRQSLMPSMTGGAFGSTSPFGGGNSPFSTGGGGGGGGGGAFGQNSPFNTGGGAGFPGTGGSNQQQGGVMSHPTGIAAFGAQQFGQGQSQWGQSFARPN